MAKATHIDYKHPDHLRVEDGGQVLCMAPSCSQYAALNRRGLPSLASPEWLAKYRPNRR